MIISFLNGDELPVPLAWYPKLHHAKPLQLTRWHLTSDKQNICWPELDMNLALAELMS